MAQSDMVFAAEADARVLEANPDTNYGSLSRLDVDNPGEVSYIRFTVTGVADPVQNARLRLYVGNGSTDGPGLYGTDNSWEENGLTWNNQPGPTTGVLANIGSVAKDTWAEYDLTGHVTGDGTYSFVFIADGSDGIKFESREGSPPPELVLTFEGEPASTPTDTPTSTSAPSTETPTPTNTAIPSTETPTPTNTAIPSTATSTATNTPGPSTATNTPLPSTPTNTPLPPTLTSTPSTTAVPSGLSLNAVADARVLESNPGTNYGTLSRLDVDSPGEISYIRFTVSGVSGPVQNARLRLFVSNGSFDSPGLYGTDNSWTETGLTWSNRPPAVTGVIANLGLAAADTWVEYDLTGHVTGNGTYSFVFLADGSDGIRFESRESSTPPQLGLTFATGPTSTPTNT
ncbi:MAG TPA: DNRLRE domain-containing protein, partial [Anaerolineae bacterium]|nr:DNRLRE domain-containing protein [Anaerolineae bacterium]